MKRVLALLLAFALLSACAAAAADAPIATYVLPDGAEVFYLSDAGSMAVPQGLEGMYALMTNAAQRGDTYLIRMANGRALASVSCVPLYASVTPQEMLALWPQIQRSMEEEGAVLDSEACIASMEPLYGGIKMLHIQARLAVEGVWLQAEGYAFCREREMTELWAVYPESELYSGDASGADELARDRDDLAFFMESLSFPESWDEPAAGVPYTDRDGRFSMVIPQDAVALDEHSTETEISDVRSRYIAANPEGAERSFDFLLQGMMETRAVLIFTGDMQGVIDVCCTQSEHFRDATPAQLSALSPAIEEMMAGQFELAYCLIDDERVYVDGREHAALNYWLRNGEHDLMMDLLVCVLEDAWLCETDICVSEGDQTLRELLHAYVQQSLTYTPPQNALNE